MTLPCWNWVPTTNLMLMMHRCQLIGPMPQFMHKQNRCASIYICKSADNCAIMVCSSTIYFTYIYSMQLTPIPNTQLFLFLYISIFFPCICSLHIYIYITDTNKIKKHIYIESLLTDRQLYIYSLLICVYVHVLVCEVACWGHLSSVPNDFVWQFVCVWSVRYNIIWVIWVC